MHDAGREDAALLAGRVAVPREAHGRLGEHLRRLAVAGVARAAHGAAELALAARAACPTRRETKKPRVAHLLRGPLARRREEALRRRRDAAGATATAAMPSAVPAETPAAVEPALRRRSPKLIASR